MKSLLITIALTLFCGLCFSQNDTLQGQDTATYRIIKTDGGELIGKIISQDAREILLITLDDRKIYIPQHLVKEMKKVNTSDFNKSGVFIGEDKFATRYFLTTNGLPIKKGEHYVQMTLLGPDLQFGVGKNLGVGIMTSWIGMPIIGTIKKSWQLNDNIHFALGGLLGTGSWITPDWGIALPFGSLTLGDRKKNVTISGGYGSIWQSGDVNGRALTSFAGMVKITPKLSFVFDSFILLPGKTTSTTEIDPYSGDYDANTGLYTNQITYTNYSRKNALAILVPGFRWHQSEGKAFQIGLTGVITDDNLFPVPIPMIQWYRSL